MLHVARLRTPGLVPRAKDTELPDAPARTREDPWSGFDAAFGSASMSGWDSDVADVKDMMKD
jgi:hypothetical protein